MDYKIGCSGYYYDSWRNSFYKTELDPKEYLTFYSSIFNTVELNRTFYKIPTVASLKKEALQTPDDFCFSVKMHKGITHQKKLTGTKQSIADFQDLVQEGLGQKLSHFLFQFPPSFHYSPKNLELVIANIPNEERNVVEFRHISWWNDDVRAAMENAQLTFCNIDYPGINSSFIHTSPSFYLRLHGNPELFKSAYEMTELENFYMNFPAHCKTHLIYFNNTYYEAGYTNASQLMEIVDHQAVIL